jgi:fluoride exporter
VDDRDLPFDPDLDTAEDRRHRPAAAAGPFAARRRSRWPRIHWLTVAAVAAGGFLGGLARYLVGLALPTTPGTFPWAVFLVNTAGAFILALLLILVLEVLPPTTYVRPLLGTGFCGALTTFSSVAVAVDQLATDGHTGTAVGYVAASLAAGLAAASFGIVLGRSIAAQRQKGRT